MAAHEEQSERVVAVRWLLVQVRRHERHGSIGGLLLSLPAGAFASPVVDERPAGDGEEPGPGPIRHTLLRPLRDSGEGRLLSRVLARIELAVLPYEGGEDLRCELPQQVLDRLARVIHGGSAGSDLRWRLVHDLAYLHRELDVVDDSAGYLEGTFLGRLDDPVTGEGLFHLRERAVGRRRLRIDEADRLGGGRVGEFLRGDEFAGLTKLRVQADHEPVHAADPLR